MPSSDVEVKKHKKSKKNKQPKEEEVVEEQEQEQPAPVEEEQPENGHHEESPKKKKKKNKQAPAAEEVEEEQQQEQAEEQEHENGKSDFADDYKVNEVVKSLNEVSEELVQQFKSVAEKVVKKNKNDPVAPLAAAIAIMSGATKVVTKSVLTQREGFTTYMLTKYDDEIRGKSFAFVIVKRILGEEEGDAAVSHLTFTQDRKSLVFDIPSSYDELIQEKWYNTKSLEMKPVVDEALPPLEENSRGGGGGGGPPRGIM